MRLPSKQFFGVSIALLLLAGCEGSKPCPDADGDGHPAQACGGTDCDDEDPAVHPGAEEICGNDLDDDCDPMTTDTELCACADEDDDGYTANWCQGDDCDDTDPEVHPGAEEICGNGRDEDCDGLDLACGCPDLDGDGFLDGACGGDDCDDANPAVHPGAFDTCGDGVDGDCDGVDPVRDADGDGFPSESCGGLDCDDLDRLVNPFRTEILYNGKDDDCNPGTGDEGGFPYPDQDGDGYDDVHAPGGTDCDDRNAAIHPDAEERCNGIDDDCDGEIDRPECVWDGGTPDDPVPCPDIQATYNVIQWCFIIDNPGPADLIQDGCAISFQMDGFPCHGRIDGAMHLFVECPGLGLPLNGVASMNTTFRITASPQCAFLFEQPPIQVSCEMPTDPICTARGRSCGIQGDNGFPYTACLRTIPEARGTGLHCNPAEDLLCQNSLCFDGACAAPCRGDLDCLEFPGTTCQERVYNDGNGVVGLLQLCMPDQPLQTRCRRTEDCAPERVCAPRPEWDRVATVCQPQQSGLQPGEACAQVSDCAGGLCLCESGACQGGEIGQCSAVCIASSDCPHNQTCGTLQVDDLGGAPHPVQVCLPQPGRCGRHPDCGWASCQLSVTANGLEIVSGCWLSGGPPGVPNPGVPCSAHSDCFSLFCNVADNYCMDLCLTDADCPTYQATTPAPACTADEDCGPEQLCDDHVCVRPFECANATYLMGFDDTGRKIWDTVRLCRPVARPCATDTPCRTGEACRLTHDQAGARAAYACQRPFGAGQLGDLCYPDGPESCRTGLCLSINAPDDTNPYCSRACTEAADCGDTNLWDCQAARIDIRPGFVSYLPACVKRAGRETP